MSHYSSRHRLSCANFTGYMRTSTECESPERIRHARSHSSLQRLSIPVPHQPRRQQLGSIHSLLDCFKSRHNLAEEQPLFVVQSPDGGVEETELNGSPPIRRYNRNSLKKQKTEDPEAKPKQLTPAEMKRKTFLRKISLQETHLNYNQDYWLEYEKSTRFHTSLDLGYFTQETDTPHTTADKQGPNEQAINDTSNIRKRQSENMPLKKKLFKRGDSEPHIIVRKKCSCNGCGHRSVRERTLRSEETTLSLDSSKGGKSSSLTPNNLNSTSTDTNSTRTPSAENLPLFLERIGQIETDFDGLEDRHSESVFSEVDLNVGPSRSTTFDFDGGDAFFGSGRGSSSGESAVLASDSPTHHPISVPTVSISRASNSPSPLG